MLKGNRTLNSMKMRLTLFVLCFALVPFINGSLLHHKEETLIGRIESIHANQNDVDDQTQDFRVELVRELEEVRQHMEELEHDVQTLKSENEIAAKNKSTSTQHPKVKRPSFISDWFQMKSQDEELSGVEIAHGLGVIPTKVDVLVKPTDGPNADWIFHGDTAFQNDDDNPEAYGGVVYFYNQTHVKLFAPKRANNHYSGRIVFTGAEDFRRLGSNHQSSQSALVRVKVWGPDDMPPPDFESKWLPLNIEDPSLAFYELEHNLGNYPALINVQVYDEEMGLISEGVGATVAPRGWLEGGGTVWGFDSQNIRIWTAYFKSKGLRTVDSTYYKPVSAADGWGNTGWGGSFLNIAQVKVSAWSIETLEANPFFALTASTDSFEFGPIDSKATPADEDLLTCFVEATSGPNNGFRFKGYGGSQAKDEPFGGSVFAYNEHGEFRTWAPNPEMNGHLIHIHSPYGNGINIQTSDNAKYVCNLLKTCQ